MKRVFPNDFLERKVISSQLIIQEMAQVPNSKAGYGYIIKKNVLFIFLKFPTKIELLFSSNRL